MKIINNLNKSAVINAIKYPFIKIASLFERVTVAHQIQTMENPKYLSTTDTSLSTENSKVNVRERSISNVTIEENEYQDIDAFRDNFISVTQDGSNQKIDSTHLYTRINKADNKKIERYVPNEQNTSSSENTEKNSEYKKGQVHRFFKETKEVEIAAPPVPPKNRMLIQEVLKKDALRIKFPRASHEMRLTILKGSELFI